MIKTRLEPIPRTVRALVFLAAIVLTFYSTTKHLLLHSTAFDLGYFDQAAYLISRGLPPVVSFWGYHFLGGHADVVMYAVALLYRIAPSVYWLFSVQAIALSLGGLPVWWLGRAYGLTKPQATTMVAVYLLQPIVFNVNLFDFHPEVIAIPCLLGAVLAAKCQQLVGFLGLLGMTLLCRDSLSLNVAALGIWLMFFEAQTKQYKHYGLLALMMGGSWFMLATQVIIPHFRPNGVEAIARYGALGDSFGGILKSLLVRPDLVAQQLLTLPNLEYCVLLFVPFIWGLSWRYLAPLIPGLPTFALNLLTNYQPQKDLVHQYSLPIVPFLILATMIAWRQGRSPLKQRRWIILWSLLVFVCLAKHSYIVIRHLDRFNNLREIHQAIALVQPNSHLLTTNQLGPHLTHREYIRLTTSQFPIEDLNQFNEILIDGNHPDNSSDMATLKQYIRMAEADRSWALVYARGDLVLFRRR